MFSKLFLISYYLIQILLKKLENECKYKLTSRKTIFKETFGNAKFRGLEVSLHCVKWESYSANCNLGFNLCTNLNIIVIMRMDTVINKNLNIFNSCINRIDLHRNLVCCCVIRFLFRLPNTGCKDLTYLRFYLSVLQYSS